MDGYRTDFTGFDTIYIGGGTPSLLSIKDIGFILERTAKNFTIAPPTEITVEVNPADVDLHWLRAVRTLGINRINIGVQSFDDAALRFLGRRHDRCLAISALKAIGDAGFDNMGLDLIYGMPGQTISDWLDTLRMALSFHPAHLSCYQLSVEPGTPLGLRQAKGEVTLPDGEALADLFFQTSTALKKAGYIHYEVSNFAKKRTFLSRHNQKYWDHTPYLGLGPAAHSFQGAKRWWNHRDLHAYLGDLERGVLPLEAAETLTEEELRLEALFLGLRTRKGINLRHYSHCYGDNLLTEKIGPITLLKKKGLVEIKNGFLRPTLAGLAVADSLALI